MWNIIFGAGLACSALALSVSLSYSGARKDLEDPLLYSVRGAHSADRFGTVVANVGDVDADGASDWAVGAPRFGGLLPYAGRVRVFSGATGQELLSFEGDSASDAFGSSVAGAGDVNADGHADVIIGAPRGTPNSGSAEVRSGSDGSVLWRFEGRAAGDEFGRSVAGVGDVNGDGQLDFAVGAPHADGGGSSSGELTLFSGADGSELFHVLGKTWDQLGRAVCAAGDLDRDGKADVLVGVPFSDTGAFNGGSAYALSGADGSLLFEVHGSGIGDQLGFSLAAGSDVDLDGIGDILCAAPGADVNGEIDAGAALLFSGRDGTLILEVPGEHESEYMSAVSFVGDVNGDGRPELLVGAAGANGGSSEAGRVRLLSSRDGRELQGLEGLRALDWFGASVAGLPDLNGDGLPEFVVGAPGHDDELESWGYARVYKARMTDS
ncbi:MAG: hypothetical protein ACI8X5_001595 [Planctomycetota bacterium]|jgi:hypothetical protein